MNNDAEIQVMKKPFCTKPFTMVEIREDGNIYPCCVGWTEYPFGNFNTDSFDQIWNGERAKEFRRAILDGSYKYCKLDKCFVYANRVSFTEEHISLNFHEAMSPPITVDFCHDEHCNVRCVMCRDLKKHNSAQKIEDLNEKIGSIFLPMVSNAKYVTINGQGEALASRHSRLLIKSIADKYQNVKFNIRTNGLLVDEKTLADLNILDKISSVIISLHASTKKTYDRIVLDSDFSKIIKNIEWLHKLKKDGKINLISLVAVISWLNYKEIISFAKLAKRYDAEVFFLEYCRFDTKMKFQYDKMAVFKKEHPEYNKLVRILHNKFFETNNATFSPVFQNLKPISTCEWLKYRFIKIMEKIKKLIKRIVRKIFSKIGFEIRRLPKVSPKENILEKINFTHPYYRDYLEDIQNRYNFEGKTVYEIGADKNLECALAVIKLGAKCVYAANPEIIPEKSPHGKIKIIKDLGENSKFEDGKFDIIYGLALLEHVLNPAELANEISRLLKPGANAYLAGWPMWTSQDGNHFWRDTATASYRHGAGYFDKWYHLTYPAFGEFKEYMLDRNMHQDDIQIAYSDVFEHPHLSRLSATEIIDIFKSKPELEVSVFRYITDDEPNYNFEKAKEKYSEEDLMTRGITLYITKKQ